MSRAHDEIRLSPEEFRLFGELFNRHCGLQFGPESRISMERRLRERVVVRELRSFSEYYHYLRTNPHGRAELDEAIDSVTVNETYFFREDYQLRALRDEILPMLVKGGAGKNRILIWSAGCATGEEVYSIAMVVHEAGIAANREVRIFGTDISRRCIALARRGVFGESAFRAIPPEMRRRYFDERPDGAHVVEELRAMCQFGCRNLLDDSGAAIVGRPEIIFCRNVLIYLDEDSRRKVIKSFYDRLLPGGFLLLGHSESLLNVSTAFELVHVREDLVYRKPAAIIRLGASAAPAPPAAAVPPQPAPLPAGPPPQPPQGKPPFQKPGSSV